LLRLCDQGSEGASAGGPDGWVPLFGQGVAAETQQKADGGADGDAQAVAQLGIILEGFDDPGEEDLGQDAAQGAADATGRGELGALIVVDGHAGDQTGEGDNVDGVDGLVHEIRREGHREPCHAVHPAGGREDQNGADREHGGHADDPGAEFVALAAGGCEGLVQHHAHKGIGQGVEEFPEQGHHGDDGGVDHGHVDVVPGGEGGHEAEGHAAAEIAQGIADAVPGGQGTGSIGSVHMGYLLFSDGIIQQVLPLHNCF
jgi:hypothetical protein